MTAHRVITCSMRALQGADRIDPGAPGTVTFDPAPAALLHQLEMALAHPVDSAACALRAVEYTLDRAGRGLDPLAKPPFSGQLFSSLTAPVRSGIHDN